MEIKKKPMESISHKFISETVNEIFQDNLHAKRVLSLSNAIQGAITSSSLAIHAIGHGLSVAQGTISKCGIKQVDRLLSNEKVNITEFFKYWISYQLEGKKEIKLAMDWTDFAKDDQATFSIQIITRHGRSRPFLWKTVRRSDLKARMREHEFELFDLLRSCVAPDVKITLIGDRGFASVALLKKLEELNFSYIIRFLGKTYIENSEGFSKKAKEWLSASGRARTIRDANLTAKKHPVKVVACYREAKMKDGWFIVSNDSKATASKLIKCYAKRWSIECSFRDIKDDRFGFGLENVRTRACDRRDRLLLIAALAISLLTTLGAAGEAIGFDRQLKANTVKHRTLSLLRQGLQWYHSIPNMPDARLIPLITEFNNMIKKNITLHDLFNV